MNSFLNCFDTFFLSVGALCTPHLRMVLPKAMPSVIGICNIWHLPPEAGRNLSLKENFEMGEDTFSIKINLEKNYE